MNPLSAEEAEQLAASCPLEEVARLVHSPVERILLALVRNPVLTENEILMLLSRKNLTGNVIEEISQSKKWLASYAIKRAIAKHPRTPTRVSLELLKFLFVFDLVSVSLQPAVPHEVKKLAESLILSQLPKLPLGQQIALARRSTSQIAGELLGKENQLIIQAALDNPNLNEATVIKILNRPDCSAQLVEALAKHRKWSITYEVRLALLRCNCLSMANVLRFIPDLRVSDLRELAVAPKVSPQVRDYIQRVLARSRKS
jgi:hypothetical protein